MADFNRKAASAAALLCAQAALCVPSVSAATSAAPQAPISLDAQSSEVDYAKNELVFRKVKITRGPMSVYADLAIAKGQSTNLNFEDSQWQFTGNVKIITEQGQLTSDEADVTFIKSLLSKAVITGKPAAFEQRNAKTGKPVLGHADLITYDVAKGTVALSKNAWLSNGADDVHGELLKYNFAERKVYANPSDQSSQRVHITITPPPPSQKP
jgi:lipopolysaccharide transport protein LptA